MPPLGLLLLKLLTLAAPSSSGSHSASVRRCWRRSVEVPATAEAMVWQFLRPKSVSNPVDVTLKTPAALASTKQRSERLEKLGKLGQRLR